MNPQEVFCLNPDCPAKGQRGKGNIGVHSYDDKLYICHVCHKTFSASKGTIFHRLRTAPEIVVRVITLLAYSCPVQAAAKAFGLDERTVKRWWQRAGQHCEALHQYVVGGSQLDLQQVQTDEMRVKIQGGVVWMAMAIMVSTRLWLGGVISRKRDKVLIQQLADRIRAIALCQPLLLAVDGLPSYIDAFRRAFRSKEPRRSSRPVPPGLLARYRHRPGGQAADWRAVAYRPSHRAGLRQNH